MSEARTSVASVVQSIVFGSDRWCLWVGSVAIVAAIATTSGFFVNLRMYETHRPMRRASHHQNTTDARLHDPLGGSVLGPALGSPPQRCWRLPDAMWSGLPTTVQLGDVCIDDSHSRRFLRARIDQTSITTWSRHSSPLVPFTGG
jgi:hypothetical protein